MFHECMTLGDEWWNGYFTNRVPTARTGNYSCAPILAAAVVETLGRGYQIAFSSGWAKHGQRKKEAMQCKCANQRKIKAGSERQSHVTRCACRDAEMHNSRLCRGHAGGVGVAGSSGLVWSSAWAWAGMAATGNHGVQS
jgi:hypothetical protein